MVYTAKRMPGDPPHANPNYIRVRWGQRPKQEAQTQVLRQDQGQYGTAEASGGRVLTPIVANVDGAGLPGTTQVMESSRVLEGPEVLVVPKVPVPRVDNYDGAGSSGSAGYYLERWSA